MPLPKKYVRVSCPTCGEEPEVPADQVVLTWPEDSYAFRCPACGNGITKDTTPTIIKLLKRQGVQTVGAPPERPEVIPDADAPPVTADDIIDFHEGFDAALAELFADFDR